MLSVMPSRLSHYFYLYTSLCVHNSNAVWEPLGNQCEMWAEEYSNQKTGSSCPVLIKSADLDFRMEFYHFKDDEKCLKTLPLRSCVTAIPDGMPDKMPENRAEHPPPAQLNWKKFPTRGVLKVNGDPNKVFESMRNASQGDCAWCFDFGLSKEGAHFHKLIHKYRVPLGTAEIRTFLDLGGGSGSVVAAAAAKFGVQGITIVRDNGNIPFAEVVLTCKFIDFEMTHGPSESRSLLLGARWF